MKKLDIKGIFTRPRKLLLHPETEWQVIGRENIEGIELFKNFLVPLSVLSSACAILLRLLSTSPLYAIGTGIILFMASVMGSYIAYRVSREYLSNKVAAANRMALRLAVYSSAVFIPFHCLSSGFSEGCSLLCLRTLYVGLNQLTALDVQYRKSAIVIIGLLVIVSPIIIQQLLMIMFRIPTIYAQTSKPMQNDINIKNRRASFDYEFLEEYTAGIMLTGTEIKSIRAGKAGLVDSYCYFHNGELWIKGMYVAEYKLGTYYNHIERRERKLLLQKKELVKLERKTKESGLTIVPVRLFLNEKGFAKLRIALARGKKEYDKRETLKQKDAKREMDRYMKK